MRKSLALSAMVGLAACGGGGAAPPVASGGSGAPTPGSPSLPAAEYATPTFTIRIPPHVAGIGKRRPQFVSSGTLSIAIQLTSDSVGINPTLLSGNPAITSFTPGACSISCTIAGPPSPIGTNSYTVTTYDASGATGNPLDSGSTTVPVVQGTNNSQVVTLNGIPALLYLSAPFGGSAGTATSEPIGPNEIGVGISFYAEDADGEIITGTFANPVTISDADTNGDGTLVATGGDGCPASYPTGNPTSAATQIVIADGSTVGNFCIGGIAEGPVTITAMAAPVTLGAPNISASTSFYPTLNAPYYSVGSGSPASLIDDTTGTPVIELYATSGTGSSATVLYTESGWTNAPYDQVLSVTAGFCSVAGPFSTFGTLGASYTGLGTLLTDNASVSPTAGSCSVSVGDGVFTNPSDFQAELDVSYTTSTFGVNSIGRRAHPPK